MEQQSFHLLPFYPLLSIKNLDYSLDSQPIVQKSGNGHDCGNGHGNAVSVSPNIGLNHEISLETD